MTREQLEQYFLRIQCEPFSAPTLENLTHLQSRHTLKIPFEALNPLLGIPVKLDFRSLFQKIVLDERGGYCYEQNLLLMEVLQSLGYKVRAVTGRVIHKDNPVFRRTHVLLLVTINEQDFLVDVGFGGMVPTVPLLLIPEIEQITFLETYQLEKVKEEEYILHILVLGTWKPLYHFYLQEQYWSDFEVGNWFTSTHPESGFTQNLMLAKAGIGKRFALSNQFFTTHFPDKPSEKIVLTSVGQIRKILTDIFNLHLNNLPGLDDKLELLLGK